LHPLNFHSGHLPADESLRLLKVDDYRPGYALTLIMNDEVGKAVAFLKQI
jgi:hypothetical protein